MFGIDFSVTKHVFMVWLVAALLFVTVTWIVRRYIGRERDQPVPRGFMNALEAVVEFVRDSIVQPNVGSKWVRTWTPLLLTLFLFILAGEPGRADSCCSTCFALFNHTVLHLPADSFLTQGDARRHHRDRATSTSPRRSPRSRSSRSSSPACARTGSSSTGRTWCRTGLPWPIYFLLIPIEIMGMFVRPFALTMRLAANMTGGHIAIVAILSFVFIFADLFASASAGIGVGLVLSLPLAVGISGLEIIVVLVQAYVFTLLTAVFIGMAIHAHH